MRLYVYFVPPSTHHSAIHLHGARSGQNITRFKFARRLSVLSMEWSGNFSKEEYLALAQDIVDDDVPDTITLESFRFAAEAGGTSFAASHSSRRKQSGSEDNRWATAMSTSELTEGSGGHGFDVSSFRGSPARGLRHANKERKDEGREGGEGGEGLGWTCETISTARKHVLFRQFWIAC